MLELAPPHGRRACLSFLYEDATALKSFDGATHVYAFDRAMNAATLGVRDPPPTPRRCSLRVGPSRVGQSRDRKRHTFLPKRHTSRKRALETAHFPARAV